MGGLAPRNAHTNCRDNPLGANNCSIAIHTLRTSRRYSDNEQAVSITIYQKTSGLLQHCYLDIGLQTDTMHRAASSGPRTRQSQRIGKYEASSRIESILDLSGNLWPVGLGTD